MRTHGASGYVKGCRCAVCREGHAERARRYKAARAADREQSVRLSHLTPVERAYAETSPDFYFRGVAS